MKLPCILISFSWQLDPHPGLSERVPIVGLPSSDWPVSISVGIFLTACPTVGGALAGGRSYIRKLTEQARESPAVSSIPPWFLPPGSCLISLYDTLWPRILISIKLFLSKFLLAILFTTATKRQTTIEMGTRSDVWGTFESHSDSIKVTQIFELKILKENFLCLSGSIL